MSLIPPSHREGLYGSDSYERISQRIKVRQDSAENWLKNDPVLESGEFGYETGYPTGKLKIGTGSTRWSQLPYLMARGPAGAPGPAGPPGKGIQIKGTADVWPPDAAPKEGDLWLIGDPVPAGSPAGSQPGDGYVWTGTKWSPIGPIRGPAGEDGADGGASVSFQTSQPADPRLGDFWIDENQALRVWDGSQWVQVSASGGTTNIVSNSEPPPGTVAGELWIDPDGDPAENFSNGGLPTSVDQPVTEQINGDPIGFVNGVYYEPDVIGAVPVVVAGKRYLMPLFEAPASADTKQALFNFIDPMITSQKDGTFIGTMPNGAYSLPDFVGGVPVVVGGKNYMIPLMSE
jgi:hypothetical protein